MVTETDPEKPFAPAMETVTGALVVPACTVMDVGDTEMEKSAGGGGEFAADPPPPQPIARLAMDSKPTTSRKPKRERPILPIRSSGRDLHAKRLGLRKRNELSVW
jgi:hypothetical protein